MRRNPIRVKGGKPTYDYCALVADAYDAAPDFDPSAVPSFQALIRSVEHLFRQVESRVRVAFVDGQPYGSDRELVDGVRQTGILFISKDYNEHAVFTKAQNLKFRAVHDYFAHIGTGKDFSQRGELGSYNAQVKVTPRIAVPALFTEVAAQACYATVRGTFPDVQKVALLPGFDYYNVGKLCANCGVVPTPGRRVSRR